MTERGFNQTIETMFGRTFNDDHPELLEGEKFIINIKLGETWKPIGDVKRFRTGNKAYTNNGETVEGYVPLFAVMK